jgi:hypothetical protein
MKSINSSINTVHIIMLIKIFKEMIERWTSPDPALYQENLQ